MGACSRDDVYSAVVLSATCNCIPDAAEDNPSRINCLRYQLDGDAVNATLYSRGQCALEMYGRFASICSTVSTSIATSGKWLWKLLCLAIIFPTLNIRFDGTRS